MLRLVFQDEFRQPSAFPCRSIELRSAASGGIGASAHASREPRHQHPRPVISTPHRTTDHSTGSAMELTQPASRGRVPTYRAASRYLELCAADQRPIVPCARAGRGIAEPKIPHLVYRPEAHVTTAGRQLRRRHSRRTTLRNIQ